MDLHKELICEISVYVIGQDNFASVFNDNGLVNMRNSFLRNKFQGH